MKPAKSDSWSCTISRPIQRSQEHRGRSTRNARPAGRAGDSQAHQPVREGTFANTDLHERDRRSKYGNARRPEFHRHAVEDTQEGYVIARASDTTTRENCLMSDEWNRTSTMTRRSALGTIVASTVGTAVLATESQQRTGLGLTLSEISHGPLPT